MSDDQATFAYKDMSELTLTKTLTELTCLLDFVMRKSKQCTIINIDHESIFTSTPTNNYYSSVPNMEPYQRATDDTPLEASQAPQNVILFVDEFNLET